MKQALLITAYKNFNHLKDILDYFSSENFLFYIHIDKKSSISTSEYRSLKRLQLKFISTQYKVNWGGFNHLKAILLLADEAVKNKEIGFFHLISGQDFPVKKLEYFDRFFDKNKDYLEFFPLPNEDWNNGGYDRLERYNLHNIINYKRYSIIIEQFNRLQAKLNIKRKISTDLPKLYGGSTWWSLTRSTLQYVIDYTSKDKTFLNRLNFSFCSEEIYFQTVIMNSVYSKNVENDNLRYIDWDSDAIYKPAILKGENSMQLIKSSCLFARKFEIPTSYTLKNELLHDLKKTI